MIILLRLGSEPKGTRCRGDSDSDKSHGDTHPYHASVDAAQAITGKGLCLYMTSQSKTRESSVGWETRVIVPSIAYRVQPLCWSHLVGEFGRVTLAKAIDMDRYGSAASFPIL